MAQAAQKEEQANYIKGGAEFLALQSTEETDDEPQKELMPLESWQTLRSYLEQETQSLRTWRNSWWMENWSDLATFICPRRSIWMTQSAGGWPTANNMLRGMEINQAIVDPTATYAVRICAGGMVSGLASPSRPWFKMICANKNQQLDAASRQWMDETEDKIYTVLAQSNFYNAFAQECEDEIVYGTSPCICYDDATDIVRFYNPAVGEYYLACNGTMRVDTLYRVFVMTIRQIVSFFGEKNLPPDIRSMWEQGGSQLEVEKIIAHAIEPNFAIRGDKKTQVKGKFAYREVYWVYGTGSEQPLSFVGFVECPFTVGRWATQSNDAYGRSVGMDVLPDVIQLQMETRRKAEAMEKNIRPPLIADMSMKNQPSSQQPDSITYVPMINGGVGMRSMYDQKLNLADITADIAAIQQRINKGFFADIFMLVSEVQTGRMTAYEVAQKVSEKLQILGPVIESKLEQLKLKLKRVYAIMQRRGLISPKPPGLKGVPLTVTFVSMLAQAQKASATNGIERIIALITSMSAQFPQAADNLNSDYLVQLMNDLLGNPESVLNGPEKVQAIRQQRAQQQEMAQKAAIQQHAANTMKTGAEAAQALGGTQISGSGNVLGMLLGQQQ